MKKFARVCFIQGRQVWVTVSYFYCTSHDINRLTIFCCVWCCAFWCNPYWRKHLISVLAVLYTIDSLILLKLAGGQVSSSQWLSWTSVNFILYLHYSSLLSSQPYKFFIKSICELFSHRTTCVSWWQIDLTVSTDLVYRKLAVILHEFYSAHWYLTLYLRSYFIPMNYILSSVPYCIIINIWLTIPCFVQLWLSTYSVSDVRSCGTTISV